MFPYFSCSFLITKSESTSSSGVSPIPTRRPVVIGIPSSPALSRVFILTLGFLLGASSCGMPFPISRSLDVSSIAPKLTFVSFSIIISFFVRLPAFVWGSRPVFSITSSLISRMYSTVDECPRELSQARACPYFCSGRSPVTKSASVHLYFLPASASARTCVGSSIESIGSPGSFL